MILYSFMVSMLSLYFQISTRSVGKIALIGGHASRDFAERIDIMVKIFEFVRLIALSQILLL